MKDSIFFRAIVGFVGLGLVASTAGAADFTTRSSDRLISGSDADQVEQTFLSKIRALQVKQELAQLAEEQARPAAKSVTTTSATDSSTQQFSAQSTIIEPTSVEPSVGIYNWMTANQKQSPIGLVESYTQDGSVADQGFTYDQAASGIAFLNKGDTASAKKILDFYKSQWDGKGFWTVYNTQSAAGSKVEYMKIAGPSAWIGLFALQYNKKTGDKSALDLATNIGKWIKGLPHQNGGVAMGASDIWAGIYSVENNLDYYALARGLSTAAKNPNDRKAFANEMAGVKNWLKTSGYDASTGLFKRGPGDPLQAMDSNAWAVLVFGVSGLKSELGIDAEGLLQRTESRFAVQSDGSFGGDVLQAKGFDFSDAYNASQIGRAGMKWVEGTNHMIAAYQLLKNAYASDAAKSSYYANRADHFLSLNSQNAYQDASTLSYAYSDQAGAQVWADNPYWRTASGPSAGSSAWVYYALNGLDPFSV